MIRILARNYGTIPFWEQSAYDAVQHCTTPLIKERLALMFASNRVQAFVFYNPPQWNCSRSKKPHGIPVRQMHSRPRVMRSLLYGVAPTDLLIYRCVAANVVALLACYIPARRAMKVDPLIALR